MAGSSETVQFSWGKMRAKGGAKMDTQFYDSFTLDNVKYSLYDCVYLYQSGDPEPYIGKIVKIWQQNQAKKVKILWFFLPEEIRNYLRGPVAVKEIFLASGDGIGLADINPLEAVAGKCAVVCISKDERNRQPSPREQAMADYIFHRFFDVGKCTLSDQVPEKIAGQEVSVLLNPKNEEVTCCLDKEVQGIDQKVGGGLVAVPLPCSAAKMEDETPSAAVPLPHSAVKMDNETPFAAAPLSQSVVKEEDKNQVAAIPLPPAAAIPLPPAVEENITKATQTIPMCTQITKPTQTIPLPPAAAIPLPPAVEENITKATQTISMCTQITKPTQTIPLPPAAAILPPAVEENINKPTQTIPKRTQKVLSGQVPSKKLKLSQDLTEQTVAPVVPDVTACSEPSELTTRQADRSKWFKQIPWDEKLQIADEQGTLVYIQNLDIKFGASDIVELIHEALQLSCSAKLINHPTYDDPNNGKAYAVFKNKSAADAAISKINSGLVVGGRPLYCSKGLLKVPKPSPLGPLVGHLTISNQRMGQRQREEQKKAVSTSHCSQPNTIEYELALYWKLVQEKEAKGFRLLRMKHEEERKSFAARLGSK